MANYRIEYSSDEQILKRRIKKAIDSGSNLLNCFGFPLDFPVQSYFPDQLKTRWIGPWNGEDFSTNSNWHEIVVLVESPLQISLEKLPQQIPLVLQIREASDYRQWIRSIESMISLNPDRGIYLDFTPWHALNAFNFSLSEVTRFLYELKHRWPNRPWCRLEGLNIWDNRISQEDELEASNYEVRFDNRGGDIPLISIVIPTYNAKKFIANVLEHLSNQNLPCSKYEIVVVDDGGNDHSFEFLSLLGIFDKIKVIYIYWPRNKQRDRGEGLYRAGLSRNLGVRFATSKKILFLDSDIIVPNNFVAEAIAGLERADVIQFPRYHLTHEKSSVKTQINQINKADLYIEEEEYWKKFFESESWDNLQMYWKYTCTYALGLKKEDFLRAGRFPHFYVSYGFEDTELGYRLHKLGRKFELVKVPTVHLTSYSLSEYRFSKSKRLKLLRKTAKLFYLNTLELDIYHNLQDFMAGENFQFERFMSRISISKRK